jgi:sensor histidine kinase YesM
MGDMLVIQAENHFEGELKTEDGLPQTTKLNRNLHGFGLLSVKNIAEKYNGSMLCGTSDGLFRIEVLLQPPK